MKKLICPECGCEDQIEARVRVWAPIVFGNPPGEVHPVIGLHVEWHKGDVQHPDFDESSPAHCKQCGYNAPLKHFMAEAHEIEMGLVYSDHTWDTHIFAVPDEADLEKYVRLVLNKSQTPVVAVFVYNEMLEEDDPRRKGGIEDGYGRT